MQFNQIQADIQSDLKQHAFDGWLLYDYHFSNPLAYLLLDIPRNKLLTRRFFYWIPQQGECIKIVPFIESDTLDHLPGQKKIYQSWQELEALLFALLKGIKSIAMEYSPFNALPSISKVDAGTIDLMRKIGVEVVSSSNLLQRYTSVWSDEQLVTHLDAADTLSEIVEQTWKFIGESLIANQFLTEYHVQQHMLQLMNQKGYITADSPICAVNANSANPHYCPHPDTAAPLAKGDFILLDLWCKKDVPHAVYADITRVGVAAEHPTNMQKTIFNIVKQARDAATHFIQSRYEKGEIIQGWQVDQICRNVIHDTGYHDYFIHRTGHNIGENVHGFGANLDNFETHDTRDLIPKTCFSVEPGIYLPGQFGVRLEYDIYLESSQKIRITGGIQEEIYSLFT